MLSRTSRCKWGFNPVTCYSVDSHALASQERCCSIASMNLITKSLCRSSMSLHELSSDRCRAVREQFSSLGYLYPPQRSDSEPGPLKRSESPRAQIRCLSFAQRCVGDLVFGRLRRPRVVRAFQQDRLELLPVDPPSARARPALSVSAHTVNRWLRCQVNRRGGAMPGRQQGRGEGRQWSRGG